VIYITIPQQIGIVIRILNHSLATMPQNTERPMEDKEHNVIKLEGSLKHTRRDTE